MSLLPFQFLKMSSDSGKSQQRRLVVRVKRRRDDQEPPADALLVKASKRQKTDSGSEDQPENTVFKFVGTSKTVDDLVDMKLSIRVLTFYYDEIILLR